MLHDLAAQSDIHDETEATCSSCTSSMDVFLKAIGINSPVKEKRRTSEDFTSGAVDARLRVDPISGTVPAPGEDGRRIERSGHYDNRRREVPSNSGKDGNVGGGSDNDEEDENENESLIADLETVLADKGLDAKMYLPQKNTGQANERAAVVRKRRGKMEIVCEVIVDDVPKRFRFPIANIQSINKGRGSSNVVPLTVDDNLCMHFSILSKGELSLILDNDVLRDDVVKAFRLLKQKAEKG